MAHGITTSYFGGACQFFSWNRRIMKSQSLYFRWVCQFSSRWCWQSRPLDLRYCSASNQAAVPCLLCTVGSHTGHNYVAHHYIGHNYVGHHYIGVMSLVRRGLGCLFEEPTDAVHLRHMTYEKFSTFIGMTNVLYDNDYIGHNYVGHDSLG